LAHLSLTHQRLLPASLHPAPLPTDLLALPEQVAALQQQVTTLTLLLQPQTPASAHAAVTKPPRSKADPKKPPSAASPARSTAPTSRKTAHVIPRVEYGQDGGYVVICPKKGRLPIRPASPEWFAWIAKQDLFRFVGQFGHFTAHHEWRVPRGAWRTHRHIRNHNHVRRLAPNQNLAIAVLEQAAAAPQALLTTP
jgi:hypothetical protein